MSSVVFRAVWWPSCSWWQVALRAAVGGRLDSLSYSRMASWGFARRGPDAIGPLPDALLQLSRFQAGLQLGYDL
ncbi:MAG: hypothetical protein QM765_03975 [Myxococcales bacterium]